MSTTIADVPMWVCFVTSRQIAFSMMELSKMLLTIFICFIIYAVVKVVRPSKYVQQSS